MKKTLGIALALLTCVSVPILIDAATKTTTMAVSANIAGVNSLSAAALNFGDVLVGNTQFATTTLQVTASNTLPYRIAIDAGLHKSATSRYMVNAANAGMAYNVYKDVARTQEWGDSGAAGTYAAGTQAGPFTGTGAVQSYTVYGTVIGPASFADGAFSDTLTITVNY